MPWSFAAGDVLARAMRRDHLATIGTLRANVEAGRAVLVAAVQRDGVPCAFAVLRVEQRELGYEGIIDAVAGALPGVKLSALLPELEKRFIGVHCISAACSRAGAVEMMAIHGYEFRETVMQKKVLS